MVKDQEKVNWIPKSTISIFHEFGHIVESKQVKNMHYAISDGSNLAYEFLVQPWSPLLKMILNVLICNEASPKKATHTHCNTQRGNRGHISLFSCIIIIKPSSHLYFRWMGACVTKNFLTQLGMLMWGCVKPSKLGPQVFSLSLAKASKVPLERKDQKNSTKWRFEG